jgi:hypothetical protein
MVSAGGLLASHRDGTVAYVQVQRDSRSRGYPSQGGQGRRLTVNDLPQRRQLAGQRIDASAVRSWPWMVTPVALAD